MEDLYKDNDEEFKKLSVNDSDQEEENEIESEEDDEENINQINIYNKNDFELENVLTILFNNNILSKVQFCPTCGQQMKLENNKNYMDEKVWQCRSKVNNHDTKKNIRENSVFEYINIPLPILYFLTFYCFTEKYSLDKSFLEVNDL